MKIGFQLKHLDPRRGGAETYVCFTARRLLENGHEVHAFTGGFDAVPEGLRTHLVKPYTPDAVSAASRAAGLDVVIGSGKCLGMNVFQPHDGTFPGSRRQNLALCRNPLIRSIKAVLNATLPKRRRSAEIEQRIYAQTNPRPHVIALSKMVYRDIQRYYQVPSERIHLVYNGIDVNRFTPNRCRPLRKVARQTWQIPERAACFLCVAQNYRRKGLHELIEATAFLRKRGSDDFRILVVGKQNPGKYQALANRWGCQDLVCFAGAMRDVERAYAAADAFILPTWYDPCSLVVLEAWACGLPVITTEFNGAGEMMTPGREGLLVDTPANIEGLADAMGQLLNAEQRTPMGRAARALAEQHTLDHNYRDLMKVFEIVAAEQRRMVA